MDFLKSLGLEDLPDLTRGKQNREPPNLTEAPELRPKTAEHSPLLERMVAAQEAGRGRAEAHLTVHFMARPAGPMTLTMMRHRTHLGLNDGEQVTAQHGRGVPMEPACSRRTGSPSFQASHGQAAG